MKPGVIQLYICVTGNVKTAGKVSAGSTTMASAFTENYRLSGSNGHCLKCSRDDSCCMCPVSSYD